MVALIEDKVYICCINVFINAIINKVNIEVFHVSWNIGGNEILEAEIFNLSGIAWG